ncbi:response regulator transcription factor [Pseudomonas sp. BN102]|uniref:response regulator transcription factor n=1 Tax=Pseudomonas sp. BN102 TaxID=2567886 RepID=UPI002454C144|nr:response regulator transcription factor [Pseudomonas sp. BN102]MDH4607266.1 helix-turn-helix domain-containing protein [Pseudomonas sp. BN102]
MQSYSAGKPSLLWLDLTRERSTRKLIQQFEDFCDCRLGDATLVAGCGNLRQADMICIHFNKPDVSGLNLLLEIKRSHPSIPITMFTVQHSEELAVWAMRAKVWEYMVLPLAPEDKSRYLHALRKLIEVRRSAINLGRTPVLEHNPPLPDSIRRTSSHQKHKALDKVMHYIDQNFRESVDQKELAQRCGMTPFRFSRLFKEVNGVGFMEYILGKRMDYAKALLENSQMPVTSIGYEAGFKDPSYFARAFKQLAGCTPSDYRQSLQHETTASATQPELDTTAAEIAQVVQSLEA